MDGQTHTQNTTSWAMELNGLPSSINVKNFFTKQGYVIIFFVCNLLSCCNLGIVFAKYMTICMISLPQHPSQVIIYPTQL